MWRLAVMAGSMAYADKPQFCGVCHSMQERCMRPLMNRRTGELPAGIAICHSKT